MERSTSTTHLPASRLRGSSFQHTQYISDDDDASETAAGDDEELAARMQTSIDIFDLDGEFPDHTLIDAAKTSLGGILRVGDCAECLHNGLDSFIRVAKITKKHGETYIHGDLLQRNRDVDKRWPKAGGDALRALLPTKKNELCAIMTVADAEAVSLGKALATRHISEVGVKRAVIFSNKPREEFKGQHLQEFYTGDEWKKQETHGTLFCRRKYIEVIDTRAKRITSRQIRWIDQAECDLDCGISDEHVYNTVRPSTTANTPSPKRKQEVVDISSDDEPIETFRQKSNASGKKEIFHSSAQTVEFKNSDGTKETLTYEIEERLTKSRQSSSKSNRSSRSSRSSKKWIYADLCAGAGGTSTGAKMAGLKLRYLLDFEKDACKTLRLNFAGVAVLEMDIRAFSADDTSAVTGGDRIDVMHISFPCQGHSAANTGVNPELDMERIATAYGTLENILVKCQPRVLTLEQVPGILWKKDGQHFRAQIHALTDAGYNLRWEVVNFAFYGNPQARKRVIVIAACPGHILPPYPTQTHGTGPGLKPFVTVADVLAEVPNLPRNDPMAYALARDPSVYTPWDANNPLHGTITGDGGVGNYHPSGRRNFSYQEKSQLQGFPARHKYFYSNKTSLGKQIGNAVPPIFAKALFEVIIPCLEEMDEKMRPWKLSEARKAVAEAAALEKRNAVAARNPIVLD